MFIISKLLEALQKPINRLRKFDWLNQGPYIGLCILMGCFFVYMFTHVSVEIEAGTNKTSQESKR